MTEFRYFLNGNSVVDGVVKADTARQAEMLVLERHPKTAIRVQGENRIRTRKQIMRGDIISRSPN